MRGHKLSIRPSRMLSLGGYGADATNWNRAKSLRKLGRHAARDWLTNDSESDGMEIYKDRRDRGLDLVNRLGGGEKSVWLELCKV